MESMMNDNSEGFESRMRSISGLIDQFEQIDDAAVRSSTRRLTQALLDLHAAGLRKILERLSAAGPSGQSVIDACVEDDLVCNLLLLHGLHPVDVETRVQRALARVRPALHAHGGDVELLAIAPNAVRLRLTGSCHGCASSLATLKTTIETALCELAPDIETIEVEGVSAPARGAPGLPALPILH